MVETSTQEERNKHIDRILSSMRYGEEYDFSVLFDRDNKDYPRLSRQVRDEMIQECLISCRIEIRHIKRDGKDFDVMHRMVRLTVTGNRIKNDKGWTDYYKSQKPSWFTKFLDSGSKVIAMIEAVIIIFLTPTAAYFQYKSNALETDNARLKSESEQLAKEVIFLKDKLKNAQFEVDSLNSTSPPDSYPSRLVE